MPNTTTFLSIANQGYSLIAARDQLNSEAEISVVGGQYRLWFESCRLQTLEAYNWGFARRRKALALHSDPAPDGSEWSFRYKLPADCICPRMIQNPIQTVAMFGLHREADLISGWDAIPYDLETSIDGKENTLLTNMEDAVLIYTFDQQNPKLYTPLFIRALAFLFGYNTCFKVTGKTDRKLQMLQGFTIAIQEAAASNANSQIDQPPRESEITSCR